MDEETDIGTITFAASLLHPADPINGSGVVARIHFEPLESQSDATASTFTIKRVVLADQNARRMLAKWEDNIIRQVFRDYLTIIAR